MEYMHAGGFEVKVKMLSFLFEVSLFTFYVVDCTLCYVNITDFY